MRLTKRRTAVAAASVVAAGGLVFGATSAFASPGAAPASVSVAATSSGAPGHHAGPLRKLRRSVGRSAKQLLAKGAHGQETLKNAAGGWVEHEWQSGKVVSVDGESVTVTDGTGTSWTWTLSSKTKIRVGGSAGSLSGVKTGDDVLLVGIRSGSANDAQILDDPGQASAPKASASPNATS
jgi:hypothetical protein